MSTKPAAAVSIRRGKTLRGVCLVVLAAVVIAIPIFSQSPAGARPSFEVASIKPGDPGQRGSSIMNQPGGRLVTRGMPLRALITFAYRVRDFQIIGGPGWLTTDRWDIEARAEEGSIAQPSGTAGSEYARSDGDPASVASRGPVPADDASRYQELPNYRLSVAKGGSKAKLSEDQSPYRPPEPGTPAPPPPQRGGAMPRFSMGAAGAISRQCRWIYPTSCRRWRPYWDGRWSIRPG